MSQQSTLTQTHTHTLLQRADPLMCDASLGNLAPVASNRKKKTHSAISCCAASPPGSGLFNICVQNSHRPRLGHAAMRLSTQTPFVSTFLKHVYVENLRPKVCLHISLPLLIDPRGGCVTWVKIPRQRRRERKWIHCLCWHLEGKLTQSGRGGRERG